MSDALPHPVRLVVNDDLRRSRLTVFFRLLLAIPHYFWISLIGVVVALLVFVNWFILLFVARTPKGIHDFLAGYIRYTTQLEAYVLLAANPYPAFWPLGEADYPVTLEIDPPAQQSRWKTFFRLFLAIPAFLVSGALLAGGVRFGGYGFGGPAFTVAFLLWWVALFLGALAARASGPGRVLRRLQRPAGRLPLPRHRPLPVQRPEPVRPAPRRRGAAPGPRRP